MVSLAEQAQEVANYLVEERERLFPADSIDGYTIDLSLRHSEMCIRDRC